MNDVHRFFADKIDYPDTDEYIMEGEEFIHAKTVLRVSEGSEIILLDGSGNEYTAIVARVEKHTLTAHITGVNKGEREAKVKVCLLCGALKGDKTELVVQKAAELGIYKIGVFNSSYCSAYMNGNKLERLNRVSREAAKQCRRSIAPEVVYFDSFAIALDSVKEYENKLFFCEFEDKSDIDLKNIKGSCALVVGSEGGFSKEEYALARESYGFSGVTLGKRILRAETAAISVCAITMFSLGELE